MRSPLDKARQDPKSIKASILRAARSCFARRGYGATTTRSIAREVGIDVSTMYYHWGSKQDLFEAVLQETQNDFERVLERWLARAKDLPFDQAFDAAVDELDPFLRDPDTVRILLFSIVDDADGASGWAVQATRRLVQTFRTYAERRFGDEPLPPDFDAVVLSSVALVLALVGGRAYHAEVLELDPAGDEYREQVVRIVRKFVAAGISPAARAGTGR